MPVALRCRVGRPVSQTSRRWTAVTATATATAAQAARTIQASVIETGYLGVTRRLIERFARSPQPPRAFRHRTPDAVTDREREVLTLIGTGLTSHETADRLTISVATVKAYVTRLLAKPDARDRVQLVVIAYETGLVSPPCSG